jgi:hypothetical protein
MKQFEFPIFLKHGRIIHNTVSCGLYYKDIMIVIMSIVSDGLSCEVAYDHHSDDIYATKVINYAPR